MENTVKSKIIQLVNNKYNTILTLVIFILFWVGGYSRDIKNYKVFINNEKVEFNHGIYSKNNEQYIHIDDLTSTFKDNVHNDKISGKIIITTYDNLIKINKSNVDYVLKLNDDVYFNLKKTIGHIGNNIVVSRDKIYILSLQYIQGVANKNRVEVYDKVNGQVLCYLNRHDEVKIYFSDNVRNNEIINIETVVNGETYYGYSLKNNFDYELQNTSDENKNNKFVMLKADDKFSTSSGVEYIDMVTLNMFRLSGVNNLTKLEYTDNIPSNIKLIANVNNGQKASNYDSDIVTRMLNSESNREKIIQQILDGVKNIYGVNIDFSHFRASDKDNYTQFIKELAAIMHSNNKIITVNVSNNQYIDVQAIANIVDYIVLQPYFARTLSSKTSGPISSINYVEKSIQNLLTDNIDMSKIILEIPAYTILWTERKGTVINAEQYNMKTMNAYLKENNIYSVLDSASGQNYINYTKGITTYKMWLEDECSITKKVELVNKYNLAGVSIYKSGMESNGIYTSISKSLSK